MVTRVLERDLERFFAKECKRLGLVTLKLSLNFSTGWPDRLVLLADNRVLWVELKTLTGVLSPRQVSMHSTMKQHGHHVLVIRTKKEITDALDTTPIPA